MNGTLSRRRRHAGIWAVAALFALLAACGNPIPPAVEAPEITSFTASPTSITEGGTSTLAWTVAGTATVTLSDGTNPVAIPSGATQVDVSPDATTSYTLTATNATGSDTAEVTVTVGPAVAPEITSFTATPDTINPGGTSTLAWAVVGNATFTLSDGTNPVSIDPDDTSVDVSPTATTTYTLTATNALGFDTGTATVTVVPAGTTTLSGLTATVVPGSQVRLDWSVLNATDVDVLTVANTNPNDTAPVTTLSGTATTHTMAIPVAARQVLRVCARAVDADDDVCANVTPTNVVVNADDYDPYDIGGFTPETPVAGSLRAVVATAAANSVIGFAADVTTIDLYGVALYPPGTGNVDAHLIVDKNLTISGPASGVTLTGISGYDVGTDPDDGAGGFTYRSRMLYVIPAVTVELENLTLTGGTFIYKGGGIHNAGDLTGRNLTVTGNRAWDVGGGIYNNTGGNLTLEDSLISDNRAVTEVDEVGVAFDIRGDFTICMIRSGFGGGIYNEAGGTVTLIDTVVSGNEAKVSGGGIYNNPGGSVAITGGSVADNVANHFTYTNDAAYPDPPLFSDPADGCPEDTSAFEPYSIGGGIYNGGTLEMSSGSILTNDVHNAGGGLFIDHESEMATLTNVLVQGNLAGIDNTTGFGGGIQHEYFAADGPESNYTPTGVTYGSGNLPEDILQNPIAAAPTAIGPSSLTAPLPGRYVPNPNVRER